MIITANLQKCYGSRPVLTGLNLVVKPDCLTLLIGSNGAGKTTALRLLAGLADPDAGTISVGGNDLRANRRDALAQLSFLPQAPRFHPLLTTLQVAEFYGRLRGRNAAAVRGTLEHWGMKEFCSTPTGKLSGGLRQRLALTIFELADAPILLLDEPGLSLDPEWRARLQDFLAAQAREGRTVLIATHLLGEWENRVDRCLLLKNGRCEGEVPPGQLRDAFFWKNAVNSESDLYLKA